MIAAGWDRQLLHVFRRSAVAGGNLFHQSWDGQQWLPGLTDWLNIGGELYSDPAVVCSGANTLDIFAEGPHHNLLHKQWFYDRWLPGPTDWEVCDEKISGTASAVSEVTEVIDLVWVDPGRHLFHKFNEGFGWTAAKGIGGQVAGAPVIVTSHVNRFDVFVRGVNNNLMHKFRDSGDWQPAGDAYENMGGHLQSDPAAAAWMAEPEVDTPGPVDVFAVGTDQHLIHKSFDGTDWWPALADWESMGGKMHDTPAALTLGRGRVNAIVAGPDDRLFFIGNNGFQWSPFWPLYVTAKGAHTTVATGPDRYVVLFVGSNDGLHHMMWDPTGWHVWEDHGGADL